jgi:hypothetical protein
MNEKLITFLIFVCSFSIYLLIYFKYSQKLVQSRNNLRFFGYMVIIVIFFKFLFLFFQPKFILFFLMPFCLIITIYTLKIILFNVYTAKMGLNKLKYPYEPLVMYPSTLFVTWDKTIRKKITTLEVLFSILLIILPFLMFGLCVKFLL